MLFEQFPTDIPSEDTHPFGSLSYRIRDQYHYWPSGHLMSKGEKAGKRGAGRPNTPGKVMGSMKEEGYVRFIPKGSKGVGMHRAIWMWHNGEIPEGMQVDHRNGVPSDNRIENLRLCTHSENMRNTKGKLRTKYPGLPKNVKPSGDRFIAGLYKDKRYYYGGTFNTVEEASAAATVLRTQLHGEFARHQ